VRTVAEDMGHEFDARLPPVSPYGEPLPADEPIEEAGLVTQVLDARDAVFETAGHQVAEVLDDAAQGLDQAVERGLAGIRAWGDSGNFLAYAASRYASVSLDVSKTIALGTYQGAKGAVNLVYEGSHLLSPVDWVAGHNLERAAAVAAFADPAVLREAGLAATADVRRDYAAGNFAKVAGHVLGFEMTLVAGVVGLKGLLAVRPAVQPLVGKVALEAAAEVTAEVTAEAAVDQAVVASTAEAAAGSKSPTSGGSVPDQVAQLRPDVSQLRFTHAAGDAQRPLSLYEMVDEINDWRTENGMPTTRQPVQAARPAGVVRAEELRRLIERDMAALEEAGVEEDRLYDVDPDGPELVKHLQEQKQLFDRMQEYVRELAQVERPGGHVRPVSLEKLAQQLQAEELEPVASPAAEAAPELEAVAPALAEDANSHSNQLARAISDAWHWLNDRRR
jgi:hypothetical protein